MNLPIVQSLVLATAKAESQLLDLGGGSSSTAHASGSSASIVRTIVGLAIVLAVIFGLRWVLKQFKAGKERKAAGGGLSSMATLPLGANRSLHVVRAGREVLVVGSGEHGVTPVRSYTEEEAQALGLLTEEEEGREDEEASAAPARESPVKALSSPVKALEPARALETLRAWTVRG